DFIGSEGMHEVLTEAGYSSLDICRPTQTEEWVSEWQTRELPKGNTKSVKRIISELFAGFDSSQLSIQTIKHHGNNFQLQEMRTPKGAMICMLKSEWDKVIEAAERYELPKKDYKWL